MVRGVGSIPEPELGGEAGLRGVEALEGRQEPVARGPANQGAGVVQVSDVDADEIGYSSDRGLGNSNAPLGKFRRGRGQRPRGPSQRFPCKAEVAIASSTRMAP